MRLFATCKIKQAASSSQLPTRQWNIWIQALSTPSYGHFYYILKSIYYPYKYSILSYRSFQFAGNIFILYTSIFVLEMSLSNSFINISASCCSNISLKHIILNTNLYYPEEHLCYLYYLVLPQKKSCQLPSNDVHNNFLNF